MVRERLGGVRQEVDGDMDGSYMVMLLFVPTASIFSKISNIDNGGAILISYLTAIPIIWVTSKMLKWLKI